MARIKYMPISPYDSAQLQDLERADILEATEQERLWYKSSLNRFGTEEQRDQAIKDQLLLPVNPTPYFAFSADVRNEPVLQYLNKDGSALLFHLMKKLDERTQFTRRGIKLIITSLHRCDSVQRDLNTGLGLV